MTQVSTAAILFFLPILSANPHCTQYGVCKNFEYVPAPPGRTPTCAKPGGTYCESVEHYPKQLIRFLIEKWGYDYNTLLSDESKDDFNVRRPLTYGPRPQEIYGPPPVPQVYYGSPPLIQPAISFGPITTNVSQSLEGGYPDRRYKIDPQILTNALQQPPGYTDTQFINKGGGFLYSSTVVQPTAQPVQSVQWWKRYKRSKDESQRKKRQAPPGSSTSLCPTQPSFIMPRAALNTRGNWMYTVNLNEVDDRYTQLVRSETCISSQCNGICSLPNGYTSRCEQQYVQKRLVALEGNGERLYSDTFWFPHCCVCQITPN